ncbi:MAG: Ig-like domain-containing protein [Dehalococcoidia bacterium]
MALNSVLHDLATVSVSGATPPTGDVSFAFYSNGECVDDPVFTDLVALDGANPGEAHPSQSTDPLTPGAWAFQATWSGDENYSGDVSECEWFTVGEGGQGCTPGFWQGGNGSKLWNTSPDAQWTAATNGLANPPFIHTTLFNSFFSAHADLNGLTMLDLVGTGGGPNPVRKAARSLVAAYLNASIGLDYPYTTAQLSAMWNDANDGDDSDGEFLALHTQLDAANNLHNNDVCG